MLSLEDVHDILTSGHFSRFIGAEEGPHFEAKQQHPYDLASAQGRVELTKDVSAFANASGGYLIIGLKTDRLGAVQADVVTALDLLAQADANCAQIRGMLADGIYPSIDGLDVQWVESGETAGRGVVSVVIPAQNSERQPFLMKRVFEGSEQIQQIVFGMVKRIHAGVQPFTIQDLHRAVQKGKSDISERLTRLEEHVIAIRESHQGAVAPTPAPVDVLEARVADVIAVADEIET
jgi:hypothetical protein